MIEIEGLVKRYREVKVLDNINLKINDGEIFGVVGVSGVGKSTLLRCLNLLEQWQEGSIKIDEIHIKNLKSKKLREFRKNMGMVFQNFSLIERETVFQNISFPLRCWGYSKEEIKKKVTELAKVVGIEDKLQERPKNLSGGQKQRVGIARALILNPKYLLCDECTSALDPKTTNSILELLKTLNEKYNITIVVVTHEMRVVKSICHRMAIIEGGSIAEMGKVEDIFNENSIYLRNLTGEENLGEKEDYSIIKIPQEEYETVVGILKENKINYGK
ncbi:MAG: ATP-binding cassette domain-containing protein [Lachnospiraceae bacterium]|jgi:D-methionine transport system ATP-binding protein|nr:ATP-binding cassette domain-containing protein [Lachnospiraceae bacterium]